MAKRKAPETDEITEVTGVTESTKIFAEPEPLPENSSFLKADSQKAVKTGEKYIYVGASRDGIAEGTLLDEIPETLNKPFLRELCINVSDLAQFRKRAAVTTSREAFLLRKSKEI